MNMHLRVRCMRGSGEMEGLEAKMEWLWRYKNGGGVAVVLRIGPKTENPPKKVATDCFVRFVRKIIGYVHAKSTGPAQQINWTSVEKVQNNNQNCTHHAKQHFISSLHSTFPNIHHAKQQPKQHFTTHQHPSTTHQPITPNLPS